MSGQGSRLDLPSLWVCWCSPYCGLSASASAPAGQGWESLRRCVRGHVAGCVVVVADAAKGSGTSRAGNQPSAVPSPISMLRKGVRL